jgi:sulfur carrier protein
MGRMRLEVNGEAKEVEAGATVRALLTSIGMGDTLVAVERNGVIVPRAEHATTTLTDGDRLEVVHFVGGG